jgi:hypothetical protein
LWDSFYFFASCTCIYPVDRLVVKTSLITQQNKNCIEILTENFSLAVVFQTADIQNFEIICRLYFSVSGFSDDRVTSLTILKVNILVRYLKGFAQKINYLFFPENWHLQT